MNIDQWSETMKFVVFDEYRIGVLHAGLVYELDAVLAPGISGVRGGMVELIRRYEEFRSTIEEFRPVSGGRALADLRLRPCVPTPTHVFAAPLNYRSHVEEMDGSQIVSADFRASSAAELGFFLKAPGSIVGAEGAIELPNLPGRAFHHEPELCVVMGRSARGVSAEQALDFVFGYTCLLDITLRNSPDAASERTMRKSYETFTPVGSVLVTADEIDDPDALDIELRVNGELRQKANTKDLIVSVAHLISQASGVLTLQPGDLYATGTPEGVGPIVPGDVVAMRIEKVGELTMPVESRSW